MPHEHVLWIKPGKNRVVFLEEIEVTGLTKEDVGMLKQKVFSLMEEKLIAYKASWIKESKH